MTALDMFICGYSRRWIKVGASQNREPIVEHTKRGTLREAGSAAKKKRKRFQS